MTEFKEARIERERERVKISSHKIRSLHRVVFFTLFFFVSILLISPQFAYADTTSNLVGHWTFDTTDTNWTTSTTSDTSGSNNTGTLTNFYSSTSTVTGIINQALKFDGVNDSVVLANKITNYKTVSLWFKLPVSGASSGYFFTQLAGSNSETRANIAGGLLALQVKNSTGCFWGNINVNSSGAQNFTFNNNIWYHFAFTIGATQSTVYINGAIASSTSGTCVYGTGTSIPALGRGWDTGGYLNDSLDDVRIYSRALSNQDISDLYNAGLGLFAPDAPTAATATTSISAAATVSFSPPVNNGGSNILYYTATSNPGNIIATSTGSPIVVSGLTNDTAYTFTVTATNAIGTSTSSVISNPVTPVFIPYAPILASPTVSTTTTSITFSSNITDNGGASSTIRGFYFGPTISYGSSTSTSGTYGVGSYSLSIADFACNTVYHYQAFATNSIGTGLSADATFTTPLCTVADKTIAFVSPTPNDGSYYTSTSSLPINIYNANSSPAYQFINWQNSLVGWWRGENGGQDDSSYGDTGTFQANASTTSDGNFGKTFSFGGTGNDAVNLGDHPQFNFNSNNSFTISAWVYKLDGLTQYILSKGSRYYINYSNSRWQIIMYDGSHQKMVYSVDASPSGKWVHLTATYNNVTNNLSLYVNGSFAMSDTSGVLGDITTTNPLILGNPGYTGYNWNGKIDDVLIFNRALSTTEIQSLNHVSTNQAFNYSNLSENSAYTFQANTVDGNGVLSSTEQRTVNIDVPNTSPVVSLNTPANNAQGDGSSVDFSCFVQNTNHDTSLSKIGFYTDYSGVFSKEQEQSVTGQSYAATFTKSDMSSKTFTWNCVATDTNGNISTTTPNTYTVGNTGIYVATDGSDSNPGTLDQPFLTLQKAASIALPGETVWIRGGTYRETITPTNSGSASNPIIYKAYNNEQVTVSGADLVTGWTQHSGSIYQSSSMNWDLGRGNNQLFIDGAMMLEARWPNATDPSKPTLADIQSGSNVGVIANLNDSNLTQATGTWNGATVHTVFNPRYAAFTALVSSSTPGSLNMTFDTSPSGVYPNDGHYYLTGVYNALDTAREWFYSSSTATLYIWTPNSDNPTSHIVEVKRRQHAFDLSGKSYITIQGINVFAADIITNTNSHYLTLDSLNMEYVNHFSVIPTDPGSYNTETTGVILNGTYNTLQNSTIAYSACNGVSLLGSYNKVTHSTIHDTDYMAIDCSTINTGRHRTIGNEITYNTLYNSGRDVVQLCYAEQMKMLHNTVYNSAYGLETGDLGMIYLTTTNGQGTEIAYNRVYDTKSWTYAGIYLDNTNSNFSIHDNVVFGTQYGILLNKPALMNVYNNTVIATNSGITGSTDSGLATVNIKNNIFNLSNISYSFSHASPSYVASNNIYPTTDPLFVDSANHDYHLQVSSPAIDAGLNVGLTSDMDNNSRPQGAGFDIGAYEYVTSHTIGGTISGLSGTVIIQNNSGDNLVISSDGSFTFATNVINGNSYNVSVLTQPSGQTCSVSAGSGTVSASNVTNVSIACVNNAVSLTPPGITPSYGSISHSGGGGSVQNQINNLLAMGLYTQADALAKQYGIVIAPNIIPSNTPQPFIRDLKQGMTNNDIKLLQIYLNTHGFVIAKTGDGSAGRETNYFGLLTKSALIKFQIANNILPATGDFGPRTRALLNSISTAAPTPTSPITQPSTANANTLSFTRNLEKGMTGNDVKLLQIYLNTHGFVVAKTGDGSTGRETNYFGSATKAALIKFQKANGILPATGDLGPRTRALINNISATTQPSIANIITSSFTRDLEKGMKGNDVKLLQQYLNNHGFPVATSGGGSLGHETTLFGFGTKAALVKFQKASGIVPAIGYFGPKTQQYISSH